MGELAGVARRTVVVLGVLGFVFHTVFGKAYSLVPAYFGCDLATARLMPIHLGCSLSGTLLLALAIETERATIGAVGSTLWGVGVALFPGTLGWSLRGRPGLRRTGRERRR